MKKHFSILGIFFQFILFLYIYSPPFKIVPLGVIKFISLGSIIGLLLLFHKTTGKILKYRFLAIHLIIFAFIITYTFAQDFVIYPHSLSLGQTNFYEQLLINLELLPITLFISLFLRKKLKFNHFDLIQSLVNIGIIQSFFCLIMLLLPPLRFFILGSLLEHEEVEERFLSAGFYGNYRGFGVGISYEFAFSVFQGFVLAFICLLCLHNFRKYRYLLFFTPLILLSIILNARIGLWIFVGFLLVAGAAYLRYMSAVSIIKNSLIIGFTGLLLTFWVSSLGDDSAIAKNIEWVGKSYTQTVEFFSGEGEKGTLYLLANKHIHVPESITGFTFGEGRYVFGEPARDTNSSLTSDVGYIRNIYFGGLLYLGLLFGSLLPLFWSGLKLQKEYLLKILMCFLLLACVVAHIKGNIFSSNSGYRAVYLIFIFSIVNHYITRQEMRKKQQLYWLSPQRFAAKLNPNK